jgi:micrococcal nuclease
MRAEEETTMPATTMPRSEQLRASLYHYRAKVTEVYDGDTCTVDIDLGLSTWIRGEKIRLARINAPELKGADKPRGEKARDHLRSLVLNKEVLLQTIKDEKEKYGRYLGEVWVESGGAMLNVNDAMVAVGHAKYQNY